MFLQQHRQVVIRHDNETRGLVRLATALLLFLTPHHSEFMSMSWKLKGSNANWHEPHGSVDVDFANGSHQPLIQFHDKSSKTILNVGITPREHKANHSAAGIPLEDAYVRQRDLIALFPQVSPWNFGYQVDLRMLAESTLDDLTMEIWLSIQTSLLDTHPQLELHLKGARFNNLMENGWASESSRIGLLVHPLDQADCQIDGEKDPLEMRVFGRFMEKGVIRRMRFWLIVASEPKSPSYWTDRKKEFSDSPLPLTA